VKECDVDWRDHARCLDEDPDLFFPIGTTGPAIAQAEAAKAVCRGCAVTRECLQWALNNYQDAGVWGGTTEEERRLLRRTRVGAATIAAAR
jgi:WhiB family transcriptional regulator, redox-sensing transcriptional regulator